MERIGKRSQVLLGSQCRGIGPTGAGEGNGLEEGRVLCL
jgi:hypothetical protein